MPNEKNMPSKHCERKAGTVCNVYQLVALMILPLLFPPAVTLTMIKDLFQYMVETTISEGKENVLYISKVVKELHKSLIDVHSSFQCSWIKSK